MLGADRAGKKTVSNGERDPSFPARADSNLRPSSGLERIQRRQPMQPPRGHHRLHGRIQVRAPLGPEPVRHLTEDPARPHHPLRGTVRPRYLPVAKGLQQLLLHLAVLLADGAIGDFRPKPDFAYISL